MSWRCLSNHGLVLVALGQGGGIRIRDLADHVGLAERAVQRIVTELAAAGAVERRRDGRRNVYTLRRDRPLAHDLESHRTIGDLIDAFTDTDATDPPPRRSVA